MPSRWLCLVIVVFWLVANGWLFYQDLLPGLLPGQPPPFTIDLVEESQTRRPSIDWSILHGDRPVLRARTRVQHEQDNPGVFTLTATYTPIPGAPEVPIHGILLQRMTSSYRINTTGDLLSIEVSIRGTPRLAAALRLVGVEFEADISGVVEGGAFAPRLLLQITGSPPRTLTLPEVPVASGASILLPLHPVNRLRGLQPGQGWNMTVFDPLGDSLNILQGAGKQHRLLRAKVRDEPESLRWRGREVPCLIVDYKGGDGFQGSTWVGQERGLVLRQEAILGEDRWVMNRD